MKDKLQKSNWLQLLNLIESGNFESLFKQFREFIFEFVINKNEVENLFLKNNSNRWKTIFNHPYWKVSFELFFPESILRAIFGPSAIQHAPKGSYPIHFKLALEQGLTRNDCSRNYFLHHIFLGKYLKKKYALPLYLQKLPQSIKVKYLNTMAENVSTFSNFDFVGLSNIFDWSNEKNNYFLDLANGQFDKIDFVETQIQFYFAVVFFSRPMAALAAKIPSPELRIEILRNAWEEHGEGQLKHGHGSNFIEFLNRLHKITNQDISQRGLWPELRIFNTTLVGATVLDDYLIGVSLMGIIEGMFSDISFIIGNAIISRGWLTEEQMIHYKLHQKLDTKHADDFFKILEGPYKKSQESQYPIEKGLRLGATVISSLRDPESSIEYPYGTDYFRVDHGENYTSFFNRMGKARFHLAIKNKKVVAFGAGLLRNVTISNKKVKCWYLCDLKVLKEFRGQNIPSKLFKTEIISNYLTASRIYAISMNPKNEENKVILLLKKFSWLPFSHMVPLLPRAVWQKLTINTCFVLQKIQN